MNVTFRNLSTDLIRVPGNLTGETPDLVADQILENSIKKDGVQQPLVVVPDGEHYRLVKGSRRLAKAKVIGIPVVPALIVEKPEDQKMEDFCRRLRFHLYQHRQDLSPSLRAEMVATLKEKQNLSNQQVAEVIGYKGDSMTNWLAPLKYIPEVVKAMDMPSDSKAHLTMKAARVFDPMTPMGQKRVWEQNAAELVKGGNELFAKIRAKYPPLKFRDFYHDPDAVAAKLTRVQPKRRRSTNAPDPKKAAKKKRVQTFNERESELEALEKEIERNEKLIADAIPVVRAFKRNKEIWALIPEEVQYELNVFAEKRC